MEKQIITFSANEQALIKTGGLGAYSSRKVSYIQAHFELGDNWGGYDSVRAVWYNDYKTIACVLDSLGNCIVPHEVLTVKGKVKVNLVASISDGDELTDRLTSYPVVALTVDASAKVDGENTSPITPSQFEQFAEAVRTDADRASAGATSAETSAQNASASEQASDAHADDALAYSQNSEASSVRASGYALDAKGYAQDAHISAVNAENSAQEAEDWADKAEQSAKDLGYMEFYIDDNGHLIMERTDNVDNIDFTLENGHLIMEVL
jgi:hypothetical protein